MGECFDLQRIERVPVSKPEGLRKLRWRKRLGLGTFMSPEHAQTPF